MDEKASEPCTGGKKYHCCPKAAGGDSPGNGGGSDNSGPVSEITLTQFNNAVTANGYPAPGAAKHQIFVNSAHKGLIATKQEAAMALAQFLHESDGLRAKREYACETTQCPGSYATPGCDARDQYYYGRGYIQLSWCYNYRPASLDLYNDERLVYNPDLVADDEQTAWDTAFWYWKTSVHNQAGVSDGKFGITTWAINGALECWGGYHVDRARARYEIYKKIRAAFGLQGPGIESGCYN
jgi:predicted chitinase